MSVLSNGYLVTVHSSGLIAYRMNIYLIGTSCLKMTVCHRMCKPPKLEDSLCLGDSFYVLSPFRVTGSRKKYCILLWLDMMTVLTKFASSCWEKKGNEEGGSIKISVVGVAAASSELEAAVRKQHENFSTFRRDASIY